MEFYRMETKTKRDFYLYFDLMKEQIKKYKNEWDKIYHEHYLYNKELGELFNKISVKESMTKDEFLKYLEIRSLNDEVNTRFKYLSCEGNKLWIEFQKIAKDFTINFPEEEIKYQGINREDGRIFFSLGKMNFDKNVKFLSITDNPKDEVI